MHSKLAPMVLMVKYFRHPPLAFWTLTLVALGALIFAGFKISASQESTLTVHQTRLADESPNVAAMLTRVSQIRTVVVPPATELNEWGAVTASMALDNAKRRSLNAGSEDPIALAYAAIALDAQALSVVDEADPEAILLLQGKIGINYDRLSAASSGINVPGLSDAPVSVNPGTGDSTLTDLTIQTNEEN